MIMKIIIIITIIIIINGGKEEKKWSIYIWRWFVSFSPGV